MAKRTVGRPRQFDDVAEQRLILDAAYATLRDNKSELTIGAILSTAGVSTRSFYRHFGSKDALLCAMYLRDAESLAGRLEKRIADSDSPSTAVENWVDEVFAVTSNTRRSERVSVIGSIAWSRAEGADAVATRARELITAPLRQVVQNGLESGSFTVDNAEVATAFIASGVMHAAGLGSAHLGDGVLDQDATARLCLVALRSN